jgi:hypothetical protein
MTLGRMPVKNFTIETIYNLDDPRLTEFRQEIFVNDLGISKDFIKEDKPHKWWIQNFEKKISEDAYKYCNRKWFSLGTDNIECIIEEGKIVGISGCRIYNSYLRTSMNLYLLKKVRNKYLGIKYLKNGWFSRHIDYATKNRCKGLFFTVYAYSKKLEGLINNHSNRTISLVNKKYLLYIDQIEQIGKFVLNGVPQTFFYYKLTDNFNIKEVINES